MFRHPRKRHARWPGAVVLAACIAAVPGTQAVPAEPATGVELARFFGRWYVIARVPAASPRAVGAYFEYRPHGEGGFRDTYVARQGSFDRPPAVLERPARADPQRPASWTIQTWWFGSEERWLLYVSPDYRFAIAGEPDLEAGWILAREPVIPEWSYAGLLARAALQGYDVSRFRRVVQKPEQIGRPGYE